MNSTWYGIERKFDPAVVGSAQHAGVEQRVRVAMHPLHIAVGASCRLAQAHRSPTGHCLEQIPTPGRQHLPQQIGCGKAEFAPRRRACRSSRHARSSARESARGFTSSVTVFIQPPSHVGEEVRYKPVGIDKSVRPLAAADMDVVALASLVVVAQRADTTGDESREGTL